MSESGEFEEEFEGEGEMDEKVTFGDRTEDEDERVVARETIIDSEETAKAVRLGKQMESELRFAIDVVDATLRDVRAMQYNIAGSDDGFDFAGFDYKRGPLGGTEHRISEVLRYFDGVKFTDEIWKWWAVFLGETDLGKLRAALISRGQLSEAAVDRYIIYVRVLKQNVNQYLMLQQNIDLLEKHKGTMEELRKTHNNIFTLVKTRLDDAAEAESVMKLMKDRLLKIMSVKEELTADVKAMKKQFKEMQGKVHAVKKEVEKEKNDARNRVGIMEMNAEKRVEDAEKRVDEMEKLLMDRRMELIRLGGEGKFGPTGLKQMYALIKDRGRLELASKPTSEIEASEEERLDKIKKKVEFLDTLLAMRKRELENAAGGKKGVERLVDRYEEKAGLDAEMERKYEEMDRLEKLLAKRKEELIRLGGEGKLGQAQLEKVMEFIQTRAGLEKPDAGAAEILKRLTDAQDKKLAEDEKKLAEWEKIKRDAVRAKKIAESIPDDLKPTLSNSRKRH